MEKIHTCECGRQFIDPQAFNGHKRHCEIHHLAVYGTIDKIIKATEKGAQRNRENNQRNREIRQQERIKQEAIELQFWISEQHKCERCGKVMTEKYGSGRFCSKSCAHSRAWTPEQRAAIGARGRHFYAEHPEARKAISERVSGDNNPSRKYLHSSHIKRKIKNHELNLELGLPEFVDEVAHRVQGWQSKKIKNSYPEQFWMHVLDNNKISYMREYLVHNEFTGQKAAMYKFDFLIGDNIDIEIDGGQHLAEDIAEKDKRRDKYLASLGFVVYRIPWINPREEKDKYRVKDQIDALLAFLNDKGIKSAEE